MWKRNTSLAMLLLRLFWCLFCHVTTSNTFVAATASLKPQDFSKDDLRQIFHTENHNNVPEYSIVHIGSRTRRSTDGGHTRSVHLRAFGKDMVLTLTPNLDLARQVPMFYADPLEEKGSVSFTPLPQLEDNVGMPYQDEVSRAAVMISHHPTNGFLLLDGTIGDDLVVKPLPPHLHSKLFSTNQNTGNREREESLNNLNDDELFLDEGENLEDDVIFSEGLPLAEDAESVTGSSIMSSLNHSRNFNETGNKLPSGLLLLRRRRSTIDTGYHVIYKRELPIVESDYELMRSTEENDLLFDASDSKANIKSRRKREAPYVIYPEILVLVDYDGYLLHGQDNNAIKSYYVSFWNGVDLRYKLLKEPKVKVSIAGIIISRSRDAMPYLERNRVGRDAIDSASALTDMGKYLYQERRLPTYDIAVAITKLDMCRRTYKRGKCNRGTAGFAYVGGACVVNKRMMKVNSVAIVEDTGGFSGIIVAAHEVGHLLGAVHDGSPPPNYLGGPGARHCRWKDGYIMSDLRHTERGFRWSSCSTEQFHHFLNGETATCLYNLPHEDESLPRVLPGKLLSLDAQCKKDRGTTACFKDERVCAQLFCFDSSSGFCVSYRPAAEGSECGDGKICLNGKCVYDNENSISDFDIHRDRWSSWNDGDWDTDSGKPKQKPQTSTTYKPKTTTKRLIHNNRWTKPRTHSKNKFQPNTKWYTTSTTTHKPFKQWFTTTKQKTTTSSTTTRKPFKHWFTTPKQKKLFTPTSSTTTRKPFKQWFITDKQNELFTTTSSTTTTRRPFNFTFKSKSTTTQEPWTSRWNRNTLNSKTTKRKTFWATPKTTKKSTQTYSKTTTTTPKSTTIHRFKNWREEQFTTHNSVVQKSNDFSENCVDKLVKKSSKLTCVDFLTKYGNRYCNHRYIQKNCCKSRNEYCS